MIVNLGTKFIHARRLLSIIILLNIIIFSKMLYDWERLCYDIEESEINGYLVVNVELFRREGFLKR